MDCGGTISFYIHNLNEHIPFYLKVFINHTKIQYGKTSAIITFLEWYKCSINANLVDLPFLVIVSLISIA
jgi:hypothetical protein